MDGQHQYEINLKKDDLFICLSSDDVYFISKQMDKWFGILLDDSYVPVSMPQRPPAPATAESVPVQPASALPSPEPVAQPEPAAAGGGFIHPSQVQVPQAQPVPSAEANDLMAQQLLLQQQIAAQQQTILAQQAALQAQQAIIPQPIPQPVPQPTLQDVLQQVGQPNLPDFVNQQPAMQQPSVLNAMPAQPAFQEVNLPMAQAPVLQQPAPQAIPQPIPQPIAQPLADDPLHTEVPMPQPEPPLVIPQATEPELQPEVAAVAEPIPQPAAQPVAPPIPQPVPELVAVGAPALVPDGDSDDFEAVMNSLLRDFEDKPSQTPGFAAEAKAAQRERIEPDLSGVTSLADLCDRSNASNSEDYLLLSAYYLSRLERQDTFSLKKVNSVLVKSGLTPVNHSVLETVLTNGYLSMLPDLTGMAEVTEYQISAEGIEAAIALL